MIITLNDLPETELKQNTGIFNAICNKRAFKKSKRYDQSGYVLVEGSTTSNMGDGGFFGLLKEAYTHHLSITINPHDIWAVLVSQFITFVSNNSTQYGKLFSNDPTNKKTLAVPTGSAHRMPISSLTAELSNNLTFDSSLVLQQFSTSTNESNHALQVMLCDMASPYYKYSMYLCGINKIKIGGTQEDWYTLTKAFNSLIDMFENHSHNDMFIEFKSRVNDLLVRFQLVFDGVVDLDFWKGIYTSKNVGSGSQVEITGWCKDFVMDIPKPCYIENLTFDYGFIDYKNISTNQNFGMISGAFHCELKNSFYELIYSSTVFEYLDGEEYQLHLKKEREARQLARIVGESFLSNIGKEKVQLTNNAVSNITVTTTVGDPVIYCPHFPEWFK